MRIRLKPTLVPGDFFFKSYIESLKESQKKRKDFVDHVEKPSSYFTLGQENCWLLSYVAPAFNHRGFILTPVVDKRLYQVYVYDEIDKKKELREEAIEFLAALWIAGANKEKQIKILASKSGKVSDVIKLEIEGEDILPGNNHLSVAVREHLI